MKILVAFDESKLSQKLIALALQHARVFGAEIVLVCSREGGEKTTVEQVEESSRMLEEAKRKIEEAGVPCEAHLLVRDLRPGEDIVLFAKENQVDEIVIGIRKTSRMDKMVFGSTAQYVILKAHCPVVSLK
uniref:Universal stress protein n=1 Tax=Desulfatirhabdium butyrativorans TaxID=340467 RepID=A0A7C4MKD3_9BACT